MSEQQSPYWLDELELDALTELVNIGVSRAAASLAAMCGEEVTLTVPSVSAVTAEEAAKMIGGERDKLVGVEQAYEGEISGRALLIFPEVNSLELVRAVVGAAVKPEDIPSMAPEALLETGNVVLQACLGSLANMLQRNLEISTPELVEGRAGALLQRVSAEGVVFIFVNFVLRDRQVRGYIALLMTLVAFSALKRLVGDFVRRETE
ncbi:MAG: chemotaxis protein CheX [Caulobacteraceae bacterium]